MHRLNYRDVDVDAAVDSDEVVVAAAVVAVVGGVSDGGSSRFLRKIFFSKP